MRRWLFFDLGNMPDARLLKLVDLEALTKMRWERPPVLRPWQSNRPIGDIRRDIVGPPYAAARVMASWDRFSVSKSRPSVSKTTTAGLWGNLTELCAIHSRVETIDISCQSGSAPHHPILLFSIGERWTERVEENRGNQPHVSHAEIGLVQTISRDLKTPRALQDAYCLPTKHTRGAYVVVEPVANHHGLRWGAFRLPQG